MKKLKAILPLLLILSMPSFAGESKAIQEFQKISGDGVELKVKDGNPRVVSVSVSKGYFKCDQAEELLENLLVDLSHDEEYNNKDCSMSSIRFTKSVIGGNSRAFITPFFIFNPDKCEAQTTITCNE